MITVKSEHVEEFLRAEIVRRTEKVENARTEWDRIKPNRNFFTRLIFGRDIDSMSWKIHETLYYEPMNIRSMQKFLKVLSYNANHMNISYVALESNLFWYDQFFDEYDKL
jgi:hypothetical protein